MAEGKAMQEQLPRCRGAAAFLGGAARLRAIKKLRCVALISARAMTAGSPNAAEILLKIRARSNVSAK
jgi:hypothetical protein